MKNKSDNLVNRYKFKSFILSIKKILYKIIEVIRQIFSIILVKINRRTRPKQF